MGQYSNPNCSQTLRQDYYCTCIEVNFSHCLKSSKMSSKICDHWWQLTTQCFDVRRQEQNHTNNHVRHKNLVMWCPILRDVDFINYCLMKYGTHLIIKWIKSTIDFRSTVFTRDMSMYIKRTINKNSTQIYYYLTSYPHIT